MISFLTYNSLISSSWAESYPGDEIRPNIYNYNQVNQYQTIDAGNFYVLRVVFTTVNETEGNGGAICITSEAKLLIESSIFIKCHSTGEGGAIFFNNTNGKSFLKKVCSANSYAKQNNFCFISASVSNNCSICLEFLSITKINSTTDTNVCLGSSDIIIFKDDNFSRNECHECAAFIYAPNVIGSVSYSSFDNNTSTKYIMSFTSNSHKLDTSNIIGNTHVQRPTMYVRGILNITNSCLIENSDPMFRLSGATICNIINCTIDNINKRDEGGSVVVDNNSIPSASFINILDNKGCFSMNMPITISVCPTFNLRQYKCNMNKKRGIFIFARF